YRAITHPAVAVLTLTVTVWAWHLAPGWWEGSLRDQKIHDLQHISFTVVAMQFWWNVIDPRPLHSRIPHLPRLLYIFGGSLPKHILAAMITFSSDIFYPTYEAARPVMPIDP